MVIILLMTFPLAASSQDGKVKKESKADKVAQLIQSQRYIFKAQNATPMSGRVIQLTYGYDVKVTKDTLAAYLPYYGRAFSAPLDPSKGGINFTTTQFTYELTERKKGGWNVVISLSEQGMDTRQLNFTISQDGYTNLQVTSNNRQPINFYGYITAIEGKK